MRQGKRKTLDFYLATEVAKNIAIETHTEKGVFVRNYYRKKDKLLSDTGHNPMLKMSKKEWIKQALDSEEENEKLLSDNNSLQSENVSLKENIKRLEIEVSRVIKDLFKEFKKV